jgi:hypothetical protein
MTDDLLEKCHWPDLPDRFAAALRKAVGFILQHYAVSGIVVSGTIVRGNPDPSSDLDIYVVNKEPFRQRVQKFFGGVPAEVFVNPPSAIEGYFVKEQPSRRPHTAHMLATGVVVYETGSIVGELRARAQDLLSNPPPSPEDLTGPRYHLALLYEDALDVADRDAATARMILCAAVAGMLEFCFIRAGRFIPRRKDLLEELATLDPETAQVARQFFETLDIEAKLRLAGQIADRTIASRGFFEWEAEPEELPEQTQDD